MVQERNDNGTTPDTISGLFLRVLGKMLTPFRRENTTTLIVFVDQTGTNQKRFGDACERLRGHPESTRQDVDTARSVEQESEVLLFKETQPEAVASFQPTRMEKVLYRHAAFTSSTAASICSLHPLESESWRSLSTCSDHRQHTWIKIPLQCPCP